MHTYIFELGRNSELSRAELRARFDAFGKKFFTCEDVAIYTFEKKLENPQKILDSLGGTIKICEVFSEAKNLKDAEKEVSEYLALNHKERVIFALSIYNIQNSFKNSLKELLKNIKKSLREKVEGKVRFLNKPDENIKSVIISEEKLVENGTDINIINIKGRFLIGSTVAVQDFKKYSFRDYDRPARDAKSGMLPPKLAQIMLNLACKGCEQCIVYDPFCGSGTVLMEGLLMGYEVLGSDISEKAILDSQKNLDWFCENFKQNKSQIKDVFVADAMEVDFSKLSKKPNSIVAETYLGPPLFKVPKEDEIRVNFSEIEEIIIEFLNRIVEMKWQDLNIVLAIPFYNGKKKKYFVDGLRDKILGLGFVFEKDGNLLYSRPNQVVGRQILNFKK